MIIKRLLGITATALGLAAISCARPIVYKAVSRSGVAYWTAEGGVVIRTDKGMCVAPPAQGVRQMDYNGQLGVSAGQIPIEVHGGGAVDHKTSKLYEQSDSLLFLQHSLYRICEMYVNEAISHKQYVCLFEAIVDAGHELIELEKTLAKAEAAMYAAKKRSYELSLSSDATQGEPSTVRESPPQSTQEPGATKGSGTNNNFQNCYDLPGPGESSPKSHQASSTQGAAKP
ncbi:MAG: hypothetical protein KC636_28675 [Myxococcales bacterium]|nr:hypothetical protein [Myxococcales bacterium]